LSNKNKDVEIRYYGTLNPIDTKYAKQVIIERLKTIKVHDQRNSPQRPFIKLKVTSKNSKSSFVVSPFAIRHLFMPPVSKL
jgi:hypothetical protein